MSDFGDGWKLRHIVGLVLLSVPILAVDAIRATWNKLSKKK